MDKYTLEGLKYGRLAEFVIYHTLSDEMGDIDPQYPMLRYVCSRFELNMEQRFWLAFLTGASYCAPTVYYIYNEFPDYENVDVGRLKRWWFDRDGRGKTIFQTDRAWIRSRNQIIPMFESYVKLLDGRSQEQAFKDIQKDTPEHTYDSAYKYFGKVKHYGRFGMFLWLEAVYVVTAFPLYPTTMDWKDSSSQSSRNGLYFALGWDDLLRGHGYGKEPISDLDYLYTEDEFLDLMDLITEVKPGARMDVWNIETTLCAYKKWRLGIVDPKRRTQSHYRYPGYYLDRQYDEISKLEQNVKTGVDWSVLWQFREETYDHRYLREFGANNFEWSNEEMDRRLSLFNKKGVII